MYTFGVAESEYDIVLLAAISDEFGRHVHQKLIKAFGDYREFKVYHFDDDTDRSEAEMPSDVGQGQLQDASVQRFLNHCFSALLFSKYYLSVNNVNERPLN